MEEARDTKVDLELYQADGPAPGPPRARLSTLIGVAPAAPVVTGRPPSSGAFRDAAPASEPLHTEAQDATRGPESRVRPVVAEPVTAPPSSRAIRVSGPKHTLDAICVGDAPAPAPTTTPRRSRIAGSFLLAAAIALMVAATQSSSRHPASTALAGSPAPVAAAEPNAVAPPSPPPASVAAAAAVPATATDTSPPATTAAPKKPPAKPKHASKSRAH